MEALEVLRSGLLTTVQDRGRQGYQKFGVPVSGAADEVALRVANLLVGNPEHAAGLEITAAGPRLRMLADVILALGGAEFAAELDGNPVPWYESFSARAGQVLDIGACRQGLRAYLALAGGVDVPMVLGSRSTCLVARFGGFQGRALAKGDRLPGGPPPDPRVFRAGRVAPPRWRCRYIPTVTVRVVPGPQDAAFGGAGCRVFLESTYRVSRQADRMGCRLDGPRIAHRDSADIISDWVPLGGVQVPRDGKPIVLLADRQTTGGYPIIATVIGPDVGLVAQRRPEDALQFRAVSVGEAQEIACNLEVAVAELPAHLSGLGG